MKAEIKAKIIIYAITTIIMALMFWAFWVFLDSIEEGQKEREEMNTLKIKGCWDIVFKHFEENGSSCISGNDCRLKQLENEIIYFERDMCLIENGVFG